MTDDERRPDPDQVLARTLAEAAAARRGQLKIFFGASPGVGKTYAMLVEAKRLREQGIDVVVGVVETHGRAETVERLLHDLQVGGIVLAAETEILPDGDGHVRSSPASASGPACAACGMVLTQRLSVHRRR